VGVLTVRKVDEEVIRALKMRAAKHGRSAEAEHRLILEQALRPNVQEFLRLARESREELKGRDFSDMTDIIRRSRDSGWEE
jgi:plasmid stability protein